MLWKIKRTIDEKSVRRKQSLSGTFSICAKIKSFKHNKKQANMA